MDEPGRRMIGRWRRRAPRGERVDVTRPWREAELLVVDLETTGLDLRRDEIVSWGSVLVRQGRLVVGSAAYGVVRPRRDPADAAVKVHGLRPQDLARAPTAEEVGPQLARQLRGRILVAHAAWVEEAFLRRLLRPAGLWPAPPVIDTAALARACELVPVRGPAEPGLEDLAVRLGLPPHTPHHALGDALTTATVLLALLARLEGQREGGAEGAGALTVGELTRLSRRHSREVAPG